MTTTVDHGVSDNEGSGALHTMDDATDAFLARFLPKDAKKPSDEESETKDTESETEENDEAAETSDESPEGDAAEEGSEDADEKPVAKKYVEDDEHYVKIKVGEEELEVPVRDLKRLHGQEAALTRRSQEVAAQRKAVETESAKYATGLDVLVKRAEARANEFRGINFLALSRNQEITDDQIGVLQQEAQKAFDEERFLKGELGNFMGAVQQKQATEMAARAQETVKTLSDPASPLHIDGWNQKTYADLRGFAVDMGIDKGIVDQLVDAPVFKLLHMAKMFQQGASKVTTVKTNKTAKKIVKTSSTPVSQASTKSTKQKQTMQALTKKGSVDNAANAFLARWEASDNND